MLVDSISYYMSMLACYGAAAFLVIIFPLSMWRDYLKSKPFVEKIMFCIVSQTAFIVNLVLLLGFLKICNVVTILIGLIGEYLIIRWNYSDKQFFVKWRELNQMLLALLKRKMYLYEVRRKIKSNIITKKRNLSSNIRKNLNVSSLISAVVVISILFYNAWFLTHQVNIYHSYQFSDLPVHTSWIYGLQQGTLFVDGIYPFAMHAMIYAITTIFPIRTVEAILYFGSFQTLLSIFALYMMAREMFKWKYSPLLALVLWSVLLNQGRYAASLPQESGIFAMFAMGYYLVRILHKASEKFEISGDSKTKKAFRINQYFSRKYFTADVFLLSLSVALVIAFHFYTAIAAIVLAAAIVVANIFRFIKKQYFVPIICAAVIGAIIAVAPFGACYATGTPFQESMAWAMSVINGETWEGTDSDYLETLTNEDGAENNEEQAPAEEESTSVDPVYKRGLSLTDMVKEIFKEMKNFFVLSILPEKILRFSLIPAGITLVLSIAMLFIKKLRIYVTSYLSILMYSAVMVLMGASNALGITVILNEQRASVFYEPFLFLAIAMAMDAIFAILSLKNNRFWISILTALSIGLSAFAGVSLVSNGYLHKFFDVNLMYYNEPVYLIKEIRKENKPFTYTIVSPTDEYYAVVDDGYHFELSEFISKVEKKNEITKIPTPNIYLFIEKYTLQDYFNGPSYVNADYAKQDFSYRASNQDYYFQRNIIESKAYYWAREFQRIYPNNISVYFEDDIYICYLIKQDENVPFAMNIDYLDHLGG